MLRALALAMKARRDVHRSRAYARAADEIEKRDDLDHLVERRSLRSVPGVGPAIEKKVLEFVATGKLPAALEAPRGDEPPEEAPDVRVPKAYRDAPFPDAPDLHVHTTWSDGTLTLEQVVLFAKRLGAKAVAITDHSGSLRIARGLPPDEVRAQWKAIDELQARHPDVRILKGTECDILRDGRLDHPEDLLKGFDVVVGSLHSQLRLPKDQQTPRVLAALDHPRLSVLGHPTTQVPGRRPRAELDLKKVFAKAAERDVALEVNGNPGRIDLDEALAKKALKAGARLSLGSDGHSAREMLSLATARRIAAAAGAKESDVLNLDFVREPAGNARGADRARA